MAEDRKQQLAEMCLVEIRKTAALIRMTLNGRELIVADVIDAEFWSMLARLQGKPTTESDLPLLRELVLADLWPLRNELVLKLDVDCNPPPATGDDKAWLHGYFRAVIEEEHEGQVSGKTDRGA